ncbi:protein of unknown function [Candidatus Filomicrobium marinum]|nr:protein of unknown function [Candidatus Filomicrobium marinum]
MAGAIEERGDCLSPSSTVLQTGSLPACTVSEVSGFNNFSRRRTISPKPGAQEGELHVETCTTARGAVS